LDLRTSRKGKPSPLHIDLIGWISERARPRALTESSVASCSVTLTICFSSISPDQYDLCYAFADFILALSLILLGQPFPVSTATARLRPPLSILLVTNLISSSFSVIPEGQEKEPATLFARASEMMNLRKYDGALGLLNAVLEVDPNHSEAYRQRASVLRHKCR